MSDTYKVDTLELNEIEYDIDIKIDPDVLAAFTDDGCEADTED